MSDLITRLAQLIVQDNAVLFVGASLRQGPDQPPAVQQIADALAVRIQYQESDRSLAAVAQDFEVQRDRTALILALKEELERLGSRPDPIHQLIADAVLPKTKVITTRFDRVLEQALDQFHKPYVRIVRDVDVPRFDESKVTLIKLQGDIRDEDSLVITEDDIDAFIDNLPTVSDVVRAFFATKHLIFLGYDLDSAQFKRFFRQVIRNLAGFSRPAYAIVPQPMDEVKTRYWQKWNVKICPRDPVAFLEALAQAVKAAAQQPELAATNPLESLARPSLPPHPYKGLDSFTGADVAIFTGRTEESQRLTNRVLGHRLTVLYGESGSGKTSLLQAGAGPRLAERRALLATCAPAPGQPLGALMSRSLADAGQQAGLPPLDDGDLPTMIRAWQHVLDGPIVLAVDQFEQFFLAYSPEEREAAVRFLKELLDDRSLDLRLVLVVREDFLGRLQALEPQIPGLLDVRFRLERLGREAARAAIEEPAQLFRVAWEPALVQTLLDDLYEGDEGGVAPPQLQIVCHRLYDEVVGGDGGPAGDEVQITLARFRELGGTPAILGDYLDRAVLSFPPEQQPTVRSLLGALVSSAGVKQRLALDDLARAAEVEAAEAGVILDELTRQRLVQRYAVKLEGTEGVRLEYELTHDYLVPRIARWLGDDFWAAQKAREMVRQALPDWQSRGRLLAPGDLRLVTAQRGQVRFSDAELEMLYAAAVAYDDGPADWGASLPDAACRRVLLGLLGHAEPFARRQAARQLAALSGEDVSAALAQVAVTDPDEAVRDAAARSIAQATGPDGGAVDRAAVAQVVAAVADAATSAAALQALVTVRDLQPASQALLPADLRGPIRRRAWAARWRRNWQQILTTTLRGMQGGFAGLGLGMGLFLGLNGIHASGVDRPTWTWPVATILSGMSVGVPLAGVVGMLAAGAGAFALIALRSLQDRERPLRSWGVATVVSALVMGLGFVLLGQIFSGVLQPIRTIAAGFLIGLGLAGPATVPLKLPWPVRLGLAILTGVAAFVLAWAAGLIFNHSFWWLLVMGGVGGAGFCWGLNPGLWREDTTVDLESSEFVR